MIELLMSYALPLLALLGGGLFMYSKGKDRAQRRADAAAYEEKLRGATARAAAIQAGADRQVTATKGALDAQQDVNGLDRSAVERELRDKWTRPE